MVCDSVLLRGAPLVIEPGRSYYFSSELGVLGRQTQEEVKGRSAARGDGSGGPLAGRWRCSEKAFLRRFCAQSVALLSSPSFSHASVDAGRRRGF